MTPSSIAELFETQLGSWPGLRHGVDRLARRRTREFDIQGVRIVALHIPHRIGSTTAPTDPDTVRRRACFLCEENRPPEQRGIPFGDDFLVLCNPFPILDRHLTLVYRDHVRQRIREPIDGLGRMLAAAAALPGFMILYNGARCGASAPDHLHFQACLHREVPVIADAGRAVGWAIPDYLRPVFVVSSDQAKEVEAGFDRLMSLLPAASAEDDEPMVNVLVIHAAGRWTVLVFPRAKHRPRVFHEGVLTWSPGAIDMGGAVVLPADGDLERITASDIEAVFWEVSLSPPAVRRILSMLGEP